MELDYETILKRMGSQALAKRMTCQANDHAEYYFGRRKNQRYGLYLLYRMVCGFLRFPPVFYVGHRNALNIQVRETEIFFKSLPKGFDGYRILHISDLHIDGIPDLVPILSKVIESLEYDICVLTGDYREGMLGQYTEPADLTVALCRSIKSEVVGVLGNHDAIEMVAPLEAGGVRMLLNEHITLSRGGDEMILLGVDDPHYYQSDNVERALEGSSDDSFKILLAHSPEITHEAIAAGVDFYLCGHTHGGQICLPGGRALLTAARGPTKCKAGLWEHRGVTGYTSVGVGASTVPVRFNCPPELTVHTLRSGQR